MPAINALLIARDVSQLMRLEQVRRDFVANVSHELRTPLTVVHGYLDLIEPEQMQEYEPILRELRNQSRRMTQIVEDLLTLSRLEAQTRDSVRAHRHATPARSAASRGGRAEPGPARGQRRGADPHDLLGSTQGPAQRVFEPGQQRGALHAGRAAASRCAGRATADGADAVGHRHRPRHPRAASAAADRAFLPCLDQPIARDGRHRPRPVDRQARAAAARCASPDPERARRRQHVHLCVRPRRLLEPQALAGDPR